MLFSFFDIPQINYLVTFNKDDGLLLMTKITELPSLNDLESETLIGYILDKYEQMVQLLDMKKRRYLYIVNEYINEEPIEVFINNN